MSEAIPVAGFMVNDVTMKPGKKEEDEGTLKVVLIAEKSDLQARDKNINDVIAALNVAQTARSSVALQMLFPTE